MVNRKVFYIILFVLSMIACFLMGFICGTGTNFEPNAHNQNEEILSPKEKENRKETEEVIGSSDPTTVPTTTPQASTTEPPQTTSNETSPTTEVEQLSPAVTDPSETHVPDVTDSPTSIPYYENDLGEF